MAKVTAELSKQDLRDLEKAMKALRKKTYRQMQTGVAKATLEAESVAAETAPVDTSRLSQSIRSVFDEKILEGTVDVDPDTAAEKGFDPKKVATLLEYAPIQEKRKRFMQKGFRAGVRKLFRMLKL